MILPETVGDQHDGGAAGLVFFRSERASGNGVNSKHWKQARRCKAGFQALGLAFAGEIKTAGDVHVRSHLRKTLRLTLEILKIAGGVGDSGKSG